MKDLSEYTVPTSFEGVWLPTTVVGMLVVSAIPTKVVGILYVIFSQTRTRMSKFMDEFPVGTT